MTAMLLSHFVTWVGFQIYVEITVGPELRKAARELDRLQKQLGR